MPSAAAITRSSGVVMKPRTSSAFAPTYTVVTVIEALSSLGYCRTFSVRTAWMPAMMMIRLTTIARTGRRKNRSVNRMSVVLGLGVQLRVGLDRIVPDDRRIVAQLEGARGDQPLAIAHAVEHCHLVAAGLPEPHELL